jgi:hypothetical protein
MINNILFFFKFIGENSFSRKELSDLDLFLKTFKEFSFSIPKIKTLDIAQKIIIAKRRLNL